MHRLIGRLVATIGVDRAAAVTAVGIILQLWRRPGAAESLEALANRPRSARDGTEITDLFQTGRVAMRTRAATVHPRLRARELAVGDHAGAVPSRIV